MKIYNNPPQLTYQEKLLLKQSKSFMFHDATKSIIITDNGQWWYCSNIEAARQWLLEHGVEEIAYTPVKSK
jgi:hypothetical protein